MGRALHNCGVRLRQRKAHGDGVTSLLSAGT